MAETKVVAISEEEKSAKVLKAEEQVRQAKARLKEVKKEEKKALEKQKAHHKYMMGGVIAKYFPECFGFNEHEMNRIIACAFKNNDIKNMINVVIQDRKKEERKPENNEKSQEKQQ